MRYLLFLLIILSSCKPSTEKKAKEINYKDIHFNAIVVDTHNDILMKAVDKGVIFDQDLTGITHSDLDRWKTGGLDVQIFSVYSDGGVKNAFAIANQENI